MAEFRHLVRISNTDLKGEKQLAYALNGVKGVGVSLALAICHVTKIDASKKTGELSDAEIKKIEEVIKAPIKAGIPSWMVNRQKCPDSGDNKHLVSNDLIFQRENDIKLQRRIKSYRGNRHSLGLPVRGQCTRSNFRRNKGKVMGVKTSGKKRG